MRDAIVEKGGRVAGTESILAGMYSSCFNACFNQDSWSYNLSTPGKDVLYDECRQ